jgi:hypothetical protein
MATAGLLTGWCAASTLDEAAPSTLAPTVTPHRSDLDATIASMVERGVIANVSNTEESTTAPRLAAPLRVVAAPGESLRSHTHWRAAGQGGNA